jgi:Flp pilus assembly pilin Flp
VRSYDSGAIRYASREVMIMNHLRMFFYEEDAIGVVEIILILVVLVALVIIFKSKITTIVNKAFKKFNEDASPILGN